MPQAYSGITHLEGGDGNDTLTFSNITASGGSLAADDPAYGINLGTGWETINLFNNSAWTLTHNLTLGGSTLNIDLTSTLFAGNGINAVISAVIPGGKATVNNEGIIDLSNGFSTSDTLTIIGDYIGNGGTLLVDVNSATNSADQLIIDGSNGGGSATATQNPRRISPRIRITGWHLWR